MPGLEEPGALFMYSIACADACAHVCMHAYLGVNDAVFVLILMFIEDCVDAWLFGMCTNFSTVCLLSQLRVCVSIHAYARCGRFSTIATSLCSTLVCVCPMPVCACTHAMLRACSCSHVCGNLRAHCDRGTLNLTSRQPHEVT